MSPDPSVVTFDLDDRGRAIVAEALGSAAAVVHLPDQDAAARADVLRAAGALLARNTATELRPEERPLIHRARLLQFMSAGVDFIPLGDLPPELPIAGNSGAYAEPMAEHASRFGRRDSQSTGGPA